jgi:hypothetical protein
VELQMSEEHHIAEDDTTWSRRIAELVVDALVIAKIVERSDSERATAIAAEEICVRLALQDRPG